MIGKSTIQLFFKESSGWWEGVKIRIGKMALEFRSERINVIPVGSDELILVTNITV